jgi:hypothetical protein
MSETNSIAVAKSDGTELTRFNALRHGVLSRYAVLPWEDADEYRALVAALADEHAPQGPTEEHLVEELAGVLWRKRRLRLAEAAAHRRGLERTFDTDQETAKVALAHLSGTDDAFDIGYAVRVTPKDAEYELKDLDDDEAVTLRALDILGSRRNGAYEAALTELREDTQSWWAHTLKLKPDQLQGDEEPFTADSSGLRRFIEDKVLPWFDNRRTEIANRPLLREQAFWGIPRPRQARTAWPVRGASRSQAGKDVVDAIAFEGPAKGNRAWVIRLAKVGVEAMLPRRAK